jgi:hypothetical protein
VKKQPADRPSPQKSYDVRNCGRGNNSKMFADTWLLLAVVAAVKERIKKP